MKIVSRTVKAFREWIRFAFLTLLVVGFLRGFVLEAFTIPTSSMEKTLLVGDFLFVNKALYGAEIPGTHRKLPAVRQPEVGEVVVFRPPHDRGRVYVKRVVGTGGDTLEMRRKVLYRNGILQEEPYARNLDRRGDAFHPGMKWQTDFLAAAEPGWSYTPSRDNWGPLVVPPEKLFVLGDNRDNSEDSRYWGFIDQHDVSGKPWFVYLSLRGPDPSEATFLERIRWNRVGQIVR
jgi:signal peptidase I